MYQNNLLNLTGDPTLPDLLHEGPLPDDLFQLNDLTATIVHPDLDALNRRLDHLSLETNTQGLRIAVERAKCQKLQASVRQVRQDMSIPCPDIVMIKHNLEAMRENQNAINYQLDGEIARTSTLTFRCLSRIHQIMAALVPCVTMPSEDNYELRLMLQELNLTIQQFGVHYAASYTPRHNYPYS